MMAAAGGSSSERLAAGAAEAPDATDGGDEHDAGLPLALDRLEERVRVERRVLEFILQGPRHALHASPPACCAVRSLL